MMTATEVRTYRPIADMASLEGTILDLAKADKDLVVNLPRGIFENITALRLPARLRQLKLSANDSHILTDIQRAADRVVQAVGDYCECTTPHNVLRVRETVGVYIRNVHKHLAWRFEDLLNVRDSASTSSAYLVGIPAIRHRAFVDGTLCDLMPWQVALHPSVATKLEIEAGQRIQLCRFPETRTVVVEVVVDDTIGCHCVGLPIGEPNLADKLGGDCDGDCYVLRTFHTQECQTELDTVFEKQWADCPEPALSSIVYTWKDEQLSEKTDGEIAESKFMQKVTIAPVALDAYACFIVKMVAKDRLPLSYAQIRGLMERSLETAMDCKKALGQDPLIFRKIINGEREIDGEVRAQLRNQGYVVEDVETLVDFLREYGGDIRKLARSNPAYDALTGGPDSVERFLETSPEDVSLHFLNSIFGKHLRKPGPRRYHDKIRRSRERYGNQFFAATMDRKTGEMVVECGLAEYRIQTSEDSKAIRLSDTEVALFRPSVEVNFIARDGGLTTSCIMHNGWPSVINTIARTEYAWEIWEIISQPDADIAGADLERLVKKVLRRMFKTYEVEGASLESWSVKCGTQRYVVLDTPLPKVDGYDFITLEMMRRHAAADVLVKRGLINHRSDTASGNPGMSFYARVGKGVNAATQSDPLNHLASIKRSPVRNALGNLVDITGAESESFRTDAEVTPPVVELNVAVLPINSMDAAVVSDAVCDKLTAKMPVVVPGCDFGSYMFYPLEDGSKVQGRLDLKGVARVIPEENMPWIRYADGTKVRADVVMNLDSKGHEMLRHTHGTLALTAAAHRLRETSGGRMRVPRNVTVERIARVAQLSGLYDSDDMVTDILSPNGEPIGRYLAGRAAIGVHRQIPSVVASVHSRETITDHFPTSTSDGGVISGLAGSLCMLAEGLERCFEELHFSINPELDAEILALRSCIVRV